jgi:pseudouridine-5'-phosphate glycosidase
VLTEGASVASNRALLRHNAAVAGGLAVALGKTGA